MDKYEFYKELYHKENERRTEVNNALNIPIAIITTLSTVLYFIVTTFNYKVDNFLNYIFCGLSVIAALCILGAIYYLIRAFSNFTKGYEYSGLPSPNDLFDWDNEIVEYFKKYYGSEEEANNHFKTYLIKSFAKHTSYNMFVNDEKYSYIYKSKKLLIIGLIAILITLLPFGYNFFNKNRIIH